MQTKAHGPGKRAATGKMYNFASLRVCHSKQQTLQTSPNVPVAQIMSSLIHSCTTQCEVLEKQAALYLRCVFTLSRYISQHIVTLQGEVICKDHL